ncbi:membrane-spanning 4-domains subfamily A member 4A-like isoform X2 [Ailuropoda melanoleuca]|uniref:Membrane-spanning 4-domains subfamily A member 4A-like n=1 Tax=Ailuropoda melanoleuca TaxID=9646 RepID=G1L0T4_AILME|nr:membrane-spanning 4-domains subfamily A member 4A-like isoform X2 [Ailuropoda melanoleuca]
MQSHAGTLQAETAQDDTTNLPENESITQLRHLGTWVLPSQWQKSLLLFLKGQPQVLGAAQILIGLLTLCLGVTISPFSPYDYGHRCCMITNTGYHVWGSFSFLVSGALSVAAGRKVTKCLIQGSLGMNTVSAIVAGFGTSLIILEELVMYGNRIWRSSRGSLFIGMLTGMLFLSLAEGCIALFLSIFACRVACSVNKVVVFLPNNNNSPSVVSPEHVYDEVAF